MTSSRILILSALIAVPLAACDNGGGVGVGVGGGGGGNDIAAFAAHCEATTNMGAALCGCIAQKASEELPPIGMQILMMDDQARANELRSQLTVEQAMQTGMFMVHAPGECAAGQ